MKNENLVPKVRFKGFSDPWEQRKLKKFTKSYSGGTPSVTNSNYYGGEIPFIRSAEIRSSQTELYLTHEGLEESSSKLVEKGDILYALYGATSGQVGISKVNGAINQAVLAIIPTEGDSSVFIEQWLSLKKERIISKYLQGGQGNLSGKIVMNLTVNKPKIPKEEGMIGKLLGKIDHLIAANEDKLEQLKTLKKLMMQKIFSQEWRFKGFTDPWEQRKLGEIYAKSNEKNKNQFDVSKTISIANMYFKTKGNGAADKSITNYKVLRIGDIAFEGHASKKFSYGRMVMNDIGDGIMSPRFTTLRPIRRQVISFWKVLVHYEPIMKHILARSTKKGTMMNELVVDDFLKNSLRVPNDDEQEKIGNAFGILDSLIAANEDKLNQLKELKKYLMQNMFV